jgi:hypothetical protein
MKNFFRSGLALSVCLLVAEAQAATVTFHHNVLGSKGPSARRETSAAERGGGAPEGNVVSFNVTTDADILSIGFVKVESSVGAYQNSLGGDAEPPLDAIIAAFPAAGADSWITTPGTTSALGTLWPGDGTDASTWGDTNDNGPQQNFKFAQITCRRVRPSSSPVM